ncbi:Helix-turn-helix [[Clostridium] aminophilum]|uniref:Helix-turn-helix n=2 Tax=[Clostridium] aminophilum TaxID=1526 RepID=A0A1I6IEC4_9FIRM|nr:Helix-turn-helix [[Clostridium] aminophilum]
MLREDAHADESKIYEKHTLTTYITEHYTLVRYSPMGDVTMNISDKIKELRKKTGLSQSKFSAKFGIPVRTLQQWEQGISSPPEYLIRMMAYIMLLEEKRDNEEKMTGGKTCADNK